MHHTQQLSMTLYTTNTHLYCLSLWYSINSEKLLHEAIESVTIVLTIVVSGENNIGIHTLTWSLLTLTEINMQHKWSTKIDGVCCTHDWQEERLQNLSNTKYSSCIIYDVNIGVCLGQLDNMNMLYSHTEKTKEPKTNMANFLIWWSLMMKRIRISVSPLDTIARTYVINLILKAIPIHSGDLDKIPWYFQFLCHSCRITVLILKLQWPYGHS